jgi:hypothetical protein
MGVNRPSVEASGLTTMGKFVPHVTSSEKEKAGKKCGGTDATEIARGKNQKNSGKYRVNDEQRRRRVTFVLDF